MSVENKTNIEVKREFDGLVVKSEESKIEKQAFLSDEEAQRFYGIRCRTEFAKSLAIGFTGVGIAVGGIYFLVKSINDGDPKDLAIGVQAMAIGAALLKVSEITQKKSLLSLNILGKINEHISQRGTQVTTDRTLNPQDQELINTNL